MKFKGLLLGTMLLGMGLTACGGSGGGSTGGGDFGFDENGNPVFKNVNITFQHVITGTDSSYLTNLIKDFNKEYEGKIRVTASSVEPDTYYTNLPMATQNKMNSDVALIHAERVLQFAGETNSDNLSKYFRELEEVMEVARVEYDPANFPTKVWENVRYNDHQYGIPLDVHTCGIYVNKTMLNELGLQTPTNREELIACAKKAIASGKEGLPLSPGFPDTYAYLNGFFNFGGKQVLFEGDAGFDTSIKTTDGRVVVAQPGSKANDATYKAVDSFGDLIFEEKISAPALGTDGSIASFRNGKSLFGFDGIWLVNDVATSAKSKGFEFEVIPANIMYKSTANTDYTGDIYANGHIFVMPKNNRGGDKQSRQQASMEFIQWMLDHSTDWAKSGKIAAYKPARETAEYKAIPYISGFGEVENFRITQPTKYTAEVFGPSQQVNTLMFAKERPTDKAIRDAIEKYYNQGISYVKSSMTGGKN